MDPRIRDPHQNVMDPEQNEKIFTDLERANQRAQAAERETAALQDQLIQLQADSRQEEPGRGSPLSDPVGSATKLGRFKRSLCSNGCPF